MRGEVGREIGRWESARGRREPPTPPNRLPRRPGAGKIEWPVSECAGLFIRHPGRDIHDLTPKQCVQHGTALNLKRLKKSA
jgi:hypothetical protein